MNIRKAQKDNLVKMLNLNECSDEQEFWKILIYDSVGEAVLAPLFDVKQLRKFGVTLYLNLNEKRDKVNGANVIYFIESSKEKIDIVLNDAKNGLYANFYLNFVSSISNENLEYIAKQSSIFGISHLFQSIYDQNSNFHSLEPNIFSFKTPLKISDFNRSENLEFDSNLAENISSKLVDILATLKILPDIKAKKNTFSHLIAKKIFQKIQSILSDEEIDDNSSFVKIPSQKIVLIIAERTHDLPIMLHHTSSYQALIHDILGYDDGLVKIKQNGESLLETPEKNKTEDQTLFLDESDTFWNLNKGKSFEDVAEEVSKMVQEYKKVKEEFKVSNLENSELMNTIFELPKIRSQKMLTDKHTALASSLSKQLEKRDLADFYLAEENIMLRNNYDIEEIKRLIESPRPTIFDKTRLYLILLIKTRRINDKKFVQIHNLLFSQLNQQNLNDLKKSIENIFKILKISIPSNFSNFEEKSSKIKNFSKNRQKSSKFLNEKQDEKHVEKQNENQQNQPNNSSKTTKLFANFRTPFQSGSLSGVKLWETLKGHGQKIFSEVKSLLPPERLFPSTRMVKALALNNYDLEDFDQYDIFRLNEIRHFENFSDKPKNGLIKSTEKNEDYYNSENGRHFGNFCDNEKSGLSKNKNRDNLNNNLNKNNKIENFRHFENLAKSKSDHFDKFNSVKNQKSVFYENLNVPYEGAIVFIVGGGNYAEFQNLMDFSKGKLEDMIEFGLNADSFEILYGSTDIVPPLVFLNECLKNNGRN